MFEFEAKLIRPEGTGTWTYLTVPISVEEVFGSKGNVYVKGIINEVPYRGTLMPHGDGSHYMVVKKSLREAIKKESGDIVSVTMERDLEKREVQIPEDFLVELDLHTEVQAIFTKLSYSHQKEYVDWIESAKKPETRKNRINKSLEMLLEGKKLKG